MADIKIPEEKWRKIERQLAKLNALEAGGVDNWEWYDESLANWRKENEIDELIDGAIDDFNDLLVDADVDEPAGRGCGYSIIVNTNDLGGLLRKFADQYLEIANQK